MSSLLLASTATDGVRPWLASGAWIRRAVQNIPFPVCALGVCGIFACGAGATGMVRSSGCSASGERSGACFEG